ncbi:hypothetical protein AKO1_008223 [Acrasis kona]|uniref:AN1-type domain-containing protein n=1 Tax=Acrasis kona TaxID=1008807 RepID=A0AAW2YMS2_9EUKA
MTEFYQLGAHCALPECREKDFLPFECDACHKKFCLEHRTRESHRCEHEHIRDRVVPVCPLCNQPIPIREFEDPNMLIDNHIRLGCPKVGKTIAERNGKKVQVATGPTCTLTNCSKPASVKCKSCGQGHCLEHRNELDHNCDESLARKNQTYIGPFAIPNPLKQKPAPKTIVVDKPKKPKMDPKEVLAQLHREREARQAKAKVKNNNPEVIDLTKDEPTPPKPSQPKHSQPVHKVQTNAEYQNKSKQLSKQFSNSKFKPIGPPSIEPQDRFPLDVYFPLNSKTAPVHMYFNKSNKVGKILDVIARQGKVNNDNATELDASKRINLFNITTGLLLPTNKELQELRNDGLLQHNDGIILEFGETINLKVVEQIAEKAITHPDDTSYCSIM